MTKDGFKLIVYPGLNETLLFDLNEDPWETKNLSGDPEYGVKIREMLAELKSLQTVTGDDLELDEDTLASETKFQSIFNGHDLTGWNHGGNWGVEKGMITRNGKGGSLVYREAAVPDDFELRFDWKVAPGSNSGIYYRPTQYEYQILDNSKHADGKNPRTSAASLYFCMPPSYDATRPVGQWNSGRIVCQGTIIQHWLNENKVVDFDYTDPRFEYEVDLLDKRGGDLEARGGYLSLQDHGDPVWYRNLRWRSLSAEDDIGHETITPDKLNASVLEAEANKIKGIMERRAKNQRKESLQQQGQTTGSDKQ